MQRSSSGSRRSGTRSRVSTKRSCSSGSGQLEPSWISGGKATRWTAKQIRSSLLSRLQSCPSNVSSSPIPCTGASPAVAQSVAATCGHRLSIICRGHLARSVSLWRHLVHGLELNLYTIHSVAQPKLKKYIAL
eukprot:3937047-Rhodomonas_salina.3